MKFLLGYFQQHHIKIIKFCVIGLSNTLISYVVFLLLLKVFAVAFFAQMVSYLAGILWSYFLNSRWTFSQNTYCSTQFKRFVALQMSLLLLTSCSIALLVDVLHFNANISWFLTMVVATLCNFVMSSHWVFASKEQSKPL